mmetsp:Transcript_31263/g.73642  ORF Transcript_31263/g.73642 Transcript_31263/m.73642 type:complete len:246 (+) Transcript_31263:1721-2458(+)
MTPEKLIFSHGRCESNVARTIWFRHQTVPGTPLPLSSAVFHCHQKHALADIVHGVGVVCLQTLPLGSGGPLLTQFGSGFLSDRCRSRFGRLIGSYRRGRLGSSLFPVQSLIEVEFSVGVTKLEDSLGTIQTPSGVSGGSIKDASILGGLAPSLTLDVLVQDIFRGVCLFGTIAQTGSSNHTIVTHPRLVVGHQLRRQPELGNGSVERLHCCLGRVTHLFFPLFDGLVVVVHLVRWHGFCVFVRRR